MTSSTSAAADRKLSEELTEITKVLLESNDHSLLPVIYKLSTGNSLISRAKKLEAQQTDDTLSGLRTKIEAAIVSHGGTAYNKVYDAALAWVLSEIDSAKAAQKENDNA